MLFYMGIILLGVSILMTFIFFRHARRPKSEARVLEVKKMPMPKYPNQRAVPHARVSYRVHNRMYEEWVILASKISVNDTLILSYKAENPQDIRVYVPHKELIVIGVLGLLGLALTLGSILVAKKMGYY